MSWNFETANFSVRLPVVDQDGPQLFELLKIKMPPLIFHV